MYLPGTVRLHYYHTLYSHNIITYIRSWLEKRENNDDIIVISIFPSTMA